MMSGGDAGRDGRRDDISAYDDKSWHKVRHIGI